MTVTVFINDIEISKQTLLKEGTLIKSSLYLLSSLSGFRIKSLRSEWFALMLCIPDVSGLILAHVGIQDC